MRHTCLCLHTSLNSSPSRPLMCSSLTHWHSCISQLANSVFVQADSSIQPALLASLTTFARTLSLFIMPISLGGIVWKGHPQQEQQHWNIGQTLLQIQKMMFYWAYVTYLHKLHSIFRTIMQDMWRNIACETFVGISKMQISNCACRSWDWKRKKHVSMVLEYLFWSIYTVFSLKIF